MKINLKRPHKFFGIYHLTSLLKYVGCTEEFCDRVGDKITNKHIVEFFQRIDKFRERKESIIIEDHDSWNLYHTLSMIIAPSLRKFKESKRYGIPCMDELDKLSQKEAEKAWDDILDKMIYAFENIANDRTEEFWNIPADYDCKDYKELIRNINGGRFKLDKKAFEAHELKIKEGLELFSKHFRRLWD